MTKALDAQADLCLLFAKLEDRFSCIEAQVIWKKRILQKESQPTRYENAASV